MADVVFPGFKRVYKDNFFRYPNELEKYWHLLSGSEQKLLDFILRRTFGFQKLEDYISISQFVNGVGKNANGTGVSRAQVQRSLAGLEEKGFIRTERHRYQTRLIKLSLRDEEEKSSVKEEAKASDQILYLMSLFRGISPHMTERFGTNKREIQAMTRLVECYGVERVQGFIAAAEQANSKEFAPTISSPVELEEKLPKLIAYFARAESARKKAPGVSF